MRSPAIHSTHGPAGDNRRRLARGSVLLYALVVVAIAGLLLTGWIQLLIVRAQYVETLVAASKRRLALANGEALAREFLLRNAFFADAGAAASAGLPDAWGGFAVAAWTGNPLASVLPPTGFNHFNPAVGGGYSFGFGVTVSGGGASETRNVFLRSRSPAYSGDVLALQNPGAFSVTCDGLASLAGAFLWSPNLPNVYNVTATRYRTPTVSQPSIVMHNSGGSVVRMNNRALPAIGTSDFAGGLDVIDNPALGDASLAAKIQEFPLQIVDPVEELVSGSMESDGEGEVTIRMGSLELINFLIPGGIHTLVLQGQEDWPAFLQADALPAMMIVVVQDQSTAHDLTSIRFEGANNRRLFLAVKKFSGTQVVWDFLAASGSWRLTATLENAPAYLDGGGDFVNLVGGIRTAAAISAESPGARIQRDPDPKLLERYADRRAWLEIYAQ